MHLASLARSVVWTSGRAVAVRAVPLTCSVAIGAAIVFGPNGLRAHDVVSMMHGSLGVRATLWGAWTMLATPAIAPAFDAPGTRTLRSLRPPRALFAMLAVLSALAQWPWIALFARGGGVAQGTVAAFVVVAACASARSSALLFGTTCVLVAVDAPPLLAIAPAAALAYAATRTAWARALEERNALRIVRRTPAVVALAAAYVARMVRSARARLQSAATVVAAGGGALTLSLQNDPDARPVQRTLVVLAFPLTVACALIAAPAIETEARLAPLLRSTRTRPLTLALATFLALATPTVAFAGTAGAAAAYTSHAPQTLTVAASSWAIAIAATTATWARRASRARRPSTFILGVVAIATVFTATAATC